METPAETTQTTPAEATAAEVEAPAQEEESMDTTPAPAPVPTTTESPPVNVAPAQPVMTESSQNIPKSDSGKFIRPANPLIKPPVPKTIQDRPSKQSIEQMEEAKLKAKFGGLSKPGGSQFLQKRLNKGQMKYFDSGDYNMAKQSGKLKMRPLSGKPGGIAPVPVPKPTGEAIPTPDSIHHRKQSSEISKLAV